MGRTIIYGLAAGEGDDSMVLQTYRVVRIQTWVSDAGPEGVRIPYPPQGRCPSVCTWRSATKQTNICAGKQTNRFAVKRVLVAADRKSRICLGLGNLDARAPGVGQEIGPG